MSDATIILVVLAICATIIYVLGRLSRHSGNAEHVDPGCKEGQGPTQDEVDLWVNVFKIALKKDQSVSQAAGQADMAVYQYNTRYGEETDDEI